MTTLEQHYNTFKENAIIMIFSGQPQNDEREREREITFITFEYTKSKIMALLKGLKICFIFY